MQQRPKAPIALLCALLVVAAACTTHIPARSKPAPNSKRTSNLDWKPCQTKFECATLAVPRNWRSPGGPSIKLALIRLRAQDANPVGSLLLNPGGPGEPGTTFLRQLIEGGTVPGELLKRFDLVSWDPRGTGQSAGIACLTPKEFESKDPLPYPPTAAARRKVEDEALTIQDRCLTKFADVIPNVGTIQTVHDLDALRAALGDAKLNYVGFSYGTAIGLEYLHLYPSKVRAMVLDGIDLPGTDPITTTKAQMASFESNLNRFLNACAADSNCAFGAGNPQRALREFLFALSRGKRIPASYTLPDDKGVSHKRQGTLGYTEAVTGIAAALYSEQTWSVLRTALSDATRTADPDGHLLLALRDLLSGRQLNGTWNHSNEANAAISCADQKARATTFFGDPQRIAAWKAKMPVFGAFGAAGLPGCYRWPSATQPLTELSASDLMDAPPIIVVNSRHDPATPYANAVALMRHLRHSRLVTWEGNDHTSFAGGHSCIDDAVVPFIVTGSLPHAGLRCSPDGD